jgi:hypothetical protein
MLRVQDTLLKQRQVFEEKMAAKNRHEQWLEVKRAQQRERAQQQARDLLLQKWSINAALANVALSVRSLFLLCRQKLPLLRRVKYCARVIMKTFRQYRHLKELKRIEAEVSASPSRCSRAAPRHRISRPRAAEKRVHPHLLEISFELAHQKENFCAGGHQGDTEHFQGYGRATEGCAHLQVPSHCGAALHRILPVGHTRSLARAAAAMGDHALGVGQSRGRPSSEAEQNKSACHH